MSVTDANLDKTPRRIAGMFDAIAPRYDLLNTVLSAGPRSLLAPPGDSARSASPARKRCVDVCTGTGDVALAAARAA